MRKKHPSSTARAGDVTVQQKPSVANGDCEIIPYAEARKRVLRFLRLVGCPGNVRIHTSNDHGTHWLITYAVPSIEDPSRIFQYASIVAEKQTGYVHSFPSRSRHPIDSTDITSIRQGCTRITLDALARLEKEARSRRAR
jgi:hypothetical protein